jgi:DNA-binding CsgD family transcriptional regulator/tetratricopeptide (TPR) repeat protein
VVAQAVESLPDGEHALGVELEAHLWVSGYVALPARRLVLERRPRFRTDTASARGLALAAAALESALTKGDAAASIALAGRALDSGRLLAATGADSPPFYMAANTLLYSDDLADARRVYTDAVDQAAQRGSIQGFGSAIAWRAVTNARLGVVGDADADAQSFLRIAPDALPIGVPLAASAAIDVLVARGALDQAAELAATHPQAFAPESSLTLMPLESRAWLRLARAELEPALADFAECGEREDDWGFTNPALTSWRAGAALAAFGLERHDEARRLATAAVDQARGFGARRPLGIALRAAGLVHQGSDQLSESVAVLAESDAPLEHARSLLELGAALRRAGRRIEARRPLSDALSEARRCEAFGVASRAHDELVATGARPRKILRGGVDALTASERRIADMARSGMSNREIAQALFVTVRTVEVHLSRVYQKLDIGSRGELDRALAE